MGGTALAQQGVQTRRVSAQEFHHDIAPVVMRRLRRTLPGATMEVIRSYDDKPDFGDMDVIAQSDTLPGDAVDRLIHAFSPRAHISNGPVFSFDFDRFQVDLIRYPAPVYGFARHYFSYNDLGNLVGRIAHGMGFVFGHAGLLYPLRDPENDSRLIDRIVVTRKFDAALNFLGYSPEVYDRGFPTLEHVFAFAASTPHFDPALFVLADRSHRARTRDRKRPSYRAFIQWLQDDRARTGCLTQSRDERSSLALRRARTLFPQFAQCERDALVLHEQDKRFRALFSGTFVADVTGLQGKPLGAAMASITEQAGGRPALKAQLLACATPQQAHAIIRHLCGGAEPGPTP